MCVYQVEIKGFKVFLKTFREPAFLTFWGRAFHSLGAEQENDPSYIAVRDFGTNSDSTYRLIVSLGNVLAKLVSVKLICILE